MEGEEEEEERRDRRPITAGYISRHLLDELIPEIKTSSGSKTDHLYPPSPHTHTHRHLISFQISFLFSFLYFLNASRAGPWREGGRRRFAGEPMAVNAAAGRRQQRRARLAAH